MPLEAIASGVEFGFLKFNKIPFSQGFAIKLVMQSIGGELIECGQVTKGGPEDGCYLYIKSVKGSQICQSIWHDNGVEMVKAKCLNLGDGWKEKIDGNWVPILDMVVKCLSDFE